VGEKAGQHGQGGPLALTARCHLPEGDLAAWALTQATAWSGAPDPHHGHTWAMTVFSRKAEGKQGADVRREAMLERRKSPRIGQVGGRLSSPLEEYSLRRALGFPGEVGTVLLDCPDGQITSAAGCAACPFGTEGQLSRSQGRCGFVRGGSAEAEHRLGQRLLMAEGLRARCPYSVELQCSWGPWPDPSAVNASTPGEIAGPVPLRQTDLQPQTPSAQNRCSC